jgi:hypothetical protein
MTGDSSRVRTLGAGAANARASAAHRGRADPLARQAVAFGDAHARPDGVGAPRYVGEVQSIIEASHKKHESSRAQATATVPPGFPRSTPRRRQRR